jgi:hypothetical protein
MEIRSLSSAAKTDPWLLQYITMSEWLSILVGQGFARMGPAGLGGQVGE